MMITKLFYFDLSGKIFCEKLLRSKNFRQKLRHQVAEALRVEAEVIQKLLLPHPGQKTAKRPSVFDKLQFAHLSTTHRGGVSVSHCPFYC